ncbi:MAG TPA: hypothetical protein VFK80_00410, partial [Limnochordia bacterium]|nr:hypothetical protein [Limnochordia bacterium]
MSGPLRVGFVDYSLANYHADTYLKLFRGPLAERATVCACYGEQTDASQAWAAKNQVTWAESPAAVAQAADLVMLLAPDNMERHLPLAEQFFDAAAGKPVYVDKGLADNLEHARTLLELAERHRIPLFCSSAVPFAPEFLAWQAKGEAARYFDAEGRGPGKWANYGVHTVSPALRAFGHDVVRLRAAGREGLVRVQLEWRDGRTAHLSVNRFSGEGFALWLTGENGTKRLDLNDGTFYQNLAAAVLDFAATGQSPVPIQESLMILAILERAPQAQNEG